MIKLFFYSLVFMLLSALLGATWLVSSQTGLVWLLSQVDQHGSIMLSTNKIEGSLSDPITIHDMKLVTPAGVFEAGRVDVRWRLSKLLSGELLIENIGFNNAIFKQSSLPSAESNELKQNKTQLPELDLPVDVTVKSLQCDTCILQLNNDQRVELSSFESSVSYSDGVLHILNTNVDSDIGELSLEATLKPSGHYPPNSFARWRYVTESHQRYEGELSLSGDMSQLSFHHKLKFPVELSAKGEIKDVVNSPKWSLAIPSQTFKLSEIVHLDEQVTGTLTAIMSGDERKVFIEKLEFQEQKTQATLTLAGEHDIKQNIFDITLSWIDVQYPLVKNALVSSPQGNFRVSGKPESYAFVMSADIFEKNIENAKLNLEGSGDKTGILFNHISANVLGGEILGSSRINWFEKLTTNTNLQWSNVSWDKNKIISDGDLSLDVTNKEFSVHANSAIRGSLVPNGSWQLKALGNDVGVSSLAMSGNTLGGKVSASGYVDWEKDLSWQLTSQVDDINPGQHWVDWQGKLSSAFHVEGSRRDNENIITLNIDELNGQLRDMALTGQAGIEMRGQDIEVSQLAINVGDASAKVKGQWSNELALAWEISVPDFTSLHPNAGGKLFANGHFRGSKHSPELLMDLNANLLRWKEISITRLIAKTDLNLFEWQRLNSQIEVEQLQFGNTSINKLELFTQGDKKLHSLNMIMNINNSVVAVESHGQWQLNHWLGSFDKFDIHSKDWGDWNLKPGASYYISSDEYRLGNLCFTETDENSICLNANYHGGDWSLTSDALQFPLFVVNQWSDEYAKLDGVANWKLSIHNINNVVDAKLEAMLPATMLDLQNVETEKLAFTHTQLLANLDHTGATVNVASQLGQADEIKLSARLPKFKLSELDFDQQIVSAEAELKLSDLLWIKGLVEDVDSITGDAQANIVISGTLSQPTVQGNVTLDRGTIEIQRAGLNLYDVELHASSQGTNQINYGIRANSGDGNIVIHGTALGADTGSWRTEFTIDGENFQLVDIPEARVMVSPKLEVAVANKTVVIIGEVTVPRAKLQPKDITMAVKVSDDLEIIGENKTSSNESEWKIFSTVKFILGDRVQFYGFGFEGNIAGEVLLIDEPGQLTTGRGELNIPEGRYRAYGQRLKVENGKLLFTGGPVSNPGLDIRAVRLVDDIVSGIKVRGTVLSPQLELFSQPAMGQANALSYLVLGRPMEGASTQEDGAILFNAALALGLSGGDVLARQIGDRFGFDEMRVDTGENGEASLIIGRYLTPRLYISYGIGLLDTLDSMNLRYQLARRWRIVADRHGEELGTDLIFTIER